MVDSIDSLHKNSKNVTETSDSMGLITAETGLVNFETIHNELLSSRKHNNRHSTLWSWVIRIGLVVVILGAWQITATNNLVSPSLVSDPEQIWSYLYHAIPTEALWANVWSTFEAVLIGLLAGAAIGIALGILLHESRTLKRGLDPLVTFLNSLPRPALAPVFLLWFGLGVGAKVAVSMSIVIFVLLLNTYAGLENTNEDLLFLSDSLAMSKWQRIRFIQLPAASPAMVAGFRLGAVYSVLGVVVSEMVAAYSGLGQVLVTETNGFHMGGAFGVLILLGLMATLLNVVVSLFERKMVWSHETYQTNS